MATKYDLYAAINPVWVFSGGPEDTHHWEVRPARVEWRHRHGRYDTLDLARWWAINTNGVYHGGDTGPRTVFYPRAQISHFQIVAVEV